MSARPPATVARSLACVCTVESVYLPLDARCTLYLRVCRVYTRQCYKSDGGLRDPVRDHKPLARERNVRVSRIRLSHVPVGHGRIRMCAGLWNLGQRQRERDVLVVTYTRDLQRIRDSCLQTPPKKLVPVDGTVRKSRRSLLFSNRVRDGFSFFTLFRIATSPSRSRARGGVLERAT